MASRAPVLVVNTTKQRESGHKAQMSNIAAGKTVADVVRTSLGPRAMLKMLLDPMGGITLTNDGFAILRECEVAHPAAKSMIELSRTQDDEVGDGTTSVIILAGEMLAISAPFLERKIHPVVILRGFQRALEDAQEILRSIAVPVDTSNREQMLKLIKSAIGTKFVSRWSDLMCGLALTAVQIVTRRAQDGGDAASAGEGGDAAAGGEGGDAAAAEADVREVDIKRFARVEKVPGGEIEESRVLDGVMVNKDVVHPKMRRRIENPRIILLDCPLEYKKGESQTHIE
ncbi:T-complex protein 1 subunit gamma, partial [Coemansia biformis]